MGVRLLKVPVAALPDCFANLPENVHVVGTAAQVGAIGLLLEGPWPDFEAAEFPEVQALVHTKQHRDGRKTIRLELRDCAVTSKIIMPSRPGLVVQ